MAEGNSTIPIIQAALLVGVLVTTTMVTCSNDRLEQRLIKLEKKEPPQAPPVSTEKLEAQDEQPKRRGGGVSAADLLRREGRL